MEGRGWGRGRSIKRSSDRQRFPSRRGSGNTKKLAHPFISCASPLPPLLPFCSTGTGKTWLGMLVSHSLKSGCTLALLSRPSSSTFSSIRSIQEEAKWQFCRHTQCPARAACTMSISAMGPCPCPRLIMWICSPRASPRFSAKR